RRSGGGRRDCERTEFHRGRERRTGAAGQLRRPPAVARPAGGGGGRGGVVGLGSSGRRDRALILRRNQSGGTAARMRAAQQSHAAHDAGRAHPLIAMHPLLARQLRKTLPAGIDLTQSPWAELVAAVDAAYVQADQEREFVERTLDVVSGELTEANEKLRRDAESQVRQLTRYYEQT